MTKAKKGTVTINNCRGMIRLRCPRSWFNGKLVFLSLGIPYNNQNCLIAEGIAHQMMIDYMCNNFDFKLTKYKFLTASTNPKINVKEIFDYYFNFKSHILKKSSMKNLRTVQLKLNAMPLNILDDAKKIKFWLIENSSLEQARRCLIQLKASCDWAIEQELINVNPFESLKKIKQKSKNIPDPFTKNERDFIISQFSTHQPYFVNFVKFLFFTGCRPSEAIALNWKNVDLENNQILFCESIVEGVLQKMTKTGKNRIFPINNQLKKILIDQKKINSKNLVFLSLKLKPLDLHNFTNRIWTPLLKMINIRLRGPYHCRHTFITLCLLENVPIQQVANWVGNSPEIILKHYAGLSKMIVPEL